MRETQKIIAIILVLILVSGTFALYLGCNAVHAPNSLGAVRVNIETYRAGQNQPTHPSVVVFPEQWNGAKYWLAYSPYPYANGEEENPCLAISNDLLYWECPSELANPIADNEETGCDELKDPHLLYRDDLDRLEMWYLGRVSENLGGDGTTLLLMRKYSYDGIHWSDYEIMSSTQYLSPTVLWDGTQYQMWAIGYDLWNTEGTIIYQESQDGIHWSDPVNCYLGSISENIDIWHGAVVSHDGEYHLVFVDNTDRQEIFYCSSSDAVHFSDPEIIIENQQYWDFLYRPTLVYTEDGVTCIYGVVNAENQWYISMSTGAEETKLTGVTEAQTKDMCVLPNDVIDTHSVQYHIKKLYDTIHVYLRLELLVLAALEAGLLLIMKELRKKKHIVAIFTCANCLLSLFYIFIRLSPSAFLQRFGAIIAICCLNVGMSAVLWFIKVTLNGEKSVEE